MRVYPRASGGTIGTQNRRLRIDGLSPRERGNPWKANQPGLSVRSIPARAGEPRTSARRSPAASVYPRASGGTAVWQMTYLAQVGLSPRERGNHPRLRTRHPRPGSIPARAGEPSWVTMWLSSFTVYPRASGGTHCRPPNWWTALGLSPRERGNRIPRLDSLPADRSIPARAGEPPTRPRLSGAGRVYPRASGGTDGIEAGLAARLGLSPRERGNR